MQMQREYKTLRRVDFVNEEEILDYFRVGMIYAWSNIGAIGIPNSVIVRGVDLILKNIYVIHNNKDSIITKSREVVPFSELTNGELTVVGMACYLHEMNSGVL